MSRENVNRPIKTIAVHSGPFHGDDVLAVSLLKILYPEASVVRSREAEILKRADVRVDVGGKSDPLSGDFDHHFVGSPKREDGSTYAAAGLVWEYFGEEVLDKLGRNDGINKAILKDLLDASFFEDLDKLDVGENGASERMNQVSLALCGLNPTWEELETAGADERFEEAVEGVLAMLIERIGNMAQGTNCKAIIGEVERLKDQIISWGEERRAVQEMAVETAREIIRGALAGSQDGVAVLPRRGLPWRGIIHGLEKETGVMIWHVIEPENNGVWMATAVANESGSFVSRVGFPETWAGKREMDLEEASGIKGAVFCHPGRWISGWKGEAAAKAAVKMARRLGQTEVLRDAPPRRGSGRSI